MDVRPTMPRSAERTPRSSGAGESSLAGKRGIVVAAAAACLGLLALQLALIGRIELTFDEAYYVSWSRRLAWGYYDHPPMVAAWIRASMALFGPSEFGVRALGVLTFGAISGLVALTAWRLFGSVRVAALASLTWVAMPLAAGAPIITPDTPLVFFWTLGAAALVEVWRTRRAAWWLALGLALGLALLSKFTGAFLAAGVALALLTTPSLRRWAASIAPYAAAALALAIVAPFVVWNAEHGWATFARQLSRVPAHSFSPQFLVEFVLSQIGLMNPLVFLPVVAAVGAVFSARGRSLAPTDEARRLLVASIAPAVVYFALHALHDRVEGNWPAPLYPTLAILAADAIARAQNLASGGLWPRLVAAGRWAAPLGLLVALVVYGQAASRVLPLGAADPTLRIGGWRELTRQVDRLARERGAAFVITDGYPATSLLTYYGDPALPVVQRNQRQRWLFQDAPPEALFEAPGLAFIDTDRDFAAELAPHFARVEEVARLQRRANGRALETYVVYRVADPIPPVLSGE
jgi:4-amino-4-deoxy-L-arabinose transferase-like glycosyltransferase